MLSENGVNFFTGLSAQLEKERKTEREIYSFCHSHTYIYIFIIYTVRTYTWKQPNFDLQMFHLEQYVDWNTPKKNQLNQKKERLEET